MEIIIVYIFFFILGTVTGSFLNVCICRIPCGQSILTPPSHCPRCDARLTVIDLIPLFSYIFLRGRCRHCGEPVSWQYPAVELLCGFLFAVALWRFGLSPETLAAVVLFSILLTVSVIDIYHRIIPDGIILTGLILGVPLIFISRNDIYSSLGGFLLGGGFLFLMAVLSRGGMGGGDIKLAAMAGIYLGWQCTLLMLFLAFLSGSIAGLTVVWVQKKTMKEAIPFGPFLSLGSLLAMLFGEEVIHWYLNLLR